MKKSTFTLVLLLIVASLTNAQTIRRCNNDPNVPLGLNMYRTLQEAHNAAVSGDIIYVEPSYISSGIPVTYGDLTCTKTLRIIGNGYHHAQNLTIDQPWEQKISLVGFITIESGANTVIQGLKTTTVIIKASNVTMSRCIIGRLYLNRDNATQNASGATISHNYFDSGYSGDLRLIGYSSYNAATCNYTAF